MADDNDNSLTIQLFGTMAAQVNGRPLPKLRSRRGRWLLALLALHANKEVSRDWISGTLWPDSDTARNTLRRTLTDLRDALGVCASTLLTTTDSLCLRIPEDNVDVLAFDRLLRRADIPSLEQALALYRGPLLVECGELWIEPDRAARAEEYLGALEQMAAWHRESGNPGAALGCLRRAIEADPYRESLTIAMMQAHVENGAPAEAIHVYRKLRLFLLAELRSEPSPQTTAVYQQIRNAGQSRPAAVARVLPGVTPPEPELTLSNLPRPLTELLGREVELREVADGLLRSRLVTVTGMGGMGKTRLAIEMASELRARFPDGVWFIDLATISDPETVARAVAAVLQIREEPDRALPLTLAKSLRERCLLLLMDNCEHVLDVSARLVRTLVNECPRLYVLATSRQALGLTGEIVYRLGPLSLPGDRPVEEQCVVESFLSRFPSLRLFADRASAVAPSFALTLSSLPAIIEICRRLDGIPLALELAAARVKTLSVDQIARRIEDRFRILVGGDRTAEPRQQTLRALVDWSYDLLDPEEQTLFARLSVFAGGWTLEAAEEVCADVDTDFQSRPASAHAADRHAATIEGWRVLDWLDQLVEKSLVISEEYPDRERRYRMLETLRQYATDRLDLSGEAAAMRTRHQRWCLRFAEAAYLEMRGPNQGHWLRQVDREHDNLLQALQEAGAGEVRMRIAAALIWYWYIRGHLAEGRFWLEASLNECPDAAPDLLSRALKGAGDLAWAQGNFEAAERLHRRNLALQRESGDQRGIALTCNSLGLVAYHQSRYTSASELYSESLRIMRELDERPSVGMLLSNMSMPLLELGRLDEATALILEAQQIHREMRDNRGLSAVTHTLGRIAIRQGEFATARRYIQESYELAQEIGDRQSEATSLHTLGEIALMENETAVAERIFSEALSTFREIGARRYIAAALCALGDAVHARGDLSLARSYYRESILLEQEAGNRQGLLTSLRCLALLESDTKNTVLAMRLLGASEAERERLGIPLLPHDQAKLERAVRHLHNILGDADFENAWAEGVATSLDAAVHSVIAAV